MLVTAGCQRPEVSKPPPFEVEKQPWRFGQAEGTRLITPHYNIHITVQNELLLDVLPNFLETAHQLYMQLLPVEDPAETRSNLYIFHTRNEWERFTRRFSPARADTYLRIRSGGYAEPKGTVLYYLGRYITLAVIAHECLHMYVYRHFDRRSVPPWLNEGLACYCEGHEWRDLTPVFTPGQNRFRMNSVRRALSRGTLLKLQEMLATDAGKMVRFSPNRVAAYYAQAWSMVTFLIHGGKYTEPFTRLCRELGTKKMRTTVRAYIAAHPTRYGQRISRGEALFRSYITDDLETFSADYGVWLRKITQPEGNAWRLFGSNQRPHRPVAGAEACKLVAGADDCTLAGPVVPAARARQTTCRGRTALAGTASPALTRNTSDPQP